MGWGGDGDLPSSGFPPNSGVASEHAELTQVGSQDSLDALLIQRGSEQSRWSDDSGLTLVEDTIDYDGPHVEKAGGISAQYLPSQSFWHRHSQQPHQSPVHELPDSEPGKKALPEMVSRLAHGLPTEQPTVRLPAVLGAEEDHQVQVGPPRR